MKNLIPFLIFTTLILVVNYFLNSEKEDYYYCVGVYMFLTILCKIDEVIKVLKDYKN